MDMERLQKQMDFIVEVDKVKQIIRQTYLSDASRKEDDAEHSWHLALMAVLLSEYSNEEVDLKKVVPMVLIHDLVEIDAGDTYAYDEAGAQTKVERETKAADRIFGMLPEDQGRWFRDLWDEFEAYASNGRSWAEHGVRKSQIYKRNEHTSEGSREIWKYMQKLIDKHVELGHVIDK